MRYNQNGRKVTPLMMNKQVAPSILIQQPLRIDLYLRRSLGYL